MPRHRQVLVLAAVPALAALCIAAAGRGAGPRWSAEQRALLRSLSLSSLEPLAPDASNRYGDDPRAAALGQRLFFEPRLSATGTVSCATCHDPSRDFQDGTPLGKGVGTTARRTMPVAGTAHSPWMFWDGRSDSQWSQALGPLESAVEHGGDRTQYARVIAERYRDDYQAVFGELPDTSDLPRGAGPVADPDRRAAWERMPAARRDQISRVYANIGKAIAAYERRLEYGPSRFDRYVDAELAGRTHDSTSAFSDDEQAGLALFIGKGRCVDCHNGSRLTDDAFHNIGVPASAAAGADSGRATGARQAVAGEFSCLSRYSDARPEQCAELRFAVTEGDELLRAYKTPSLRGVARRAPYMHAGQMPTLEAVIEHYDRAPGAPAGHSELVPLHLSARERRQIEAFLRTLDGPVTAPAGFLAAPATAQLSARTAQ